MRITGKLPELLAPAGDFESLAAAVAGGADAVYVGGERFGARAFAKNFNMEELTRAVRYCHLFGVKLYVTVNTLIYDREAEAVAEYLRELYRIGIDAIIAADLGVIRLCRSVAPRLEIHGSTQMSVHNTAGADMAYELGCTRVVLARELSGEDIEKTTASCKPQVEVFLHGALCVCHSGQCLFSSLVGGRSGNRGECAQPCRLPYNGEYPISLKDLSLSEHITELIDAGVASLKIEGRMKSPSYVFTVTSIYRSLLDGGRNSNAKERAALAAAFSRGGFTDAYFMGNAQGKMLGVRSQSDKDITRDFKADGCFEERKLRVFAKVKIRIGEPAEMTVYTDKSSYTATGAVPATAISRPLLDREVRARLAKTGGTPLLLSAEDIELELDNGANLSIAELNTLRRAACDGYMNTERQGEVYATPAPPEYKENPTGRTALCLTPAVLSKLPARYLSYFDNIFVPLFSEEARDGRFGVYIPPVITDSQWGEVNERLGELRALGVTRALVGNISHLPLVRAHGMQAVGDFRLNITNKYAKAVYAELGVADVIISAELTLPMARDISGRVTVYGRIPLMLTERCFMRRGGDCDACCKFSLKDRRGAEFPIVREWRHRNLILNSAVTYMGDREGELRSFRILSQHFIFSTESAEQICSIIDAYVKGGEYPFSCSIRRIGSRQGK